MYPAIGEFRAMKDFLNQTTLEGQAGNSLACGMISKDRYFEPQAQYFKSS